MNFRICRLILLPLLIFVTAGCLTHLTKDAACVALEPVVSNIVDTAFIPVKVSFLAEQFLDANNRWPENRAELVDFAQRENKNFDFSQIATISFDPATGPETAMVIVFAPPVSGSCTSHLNHVKMNRNRR